MNDHGLQLLVGRVSMEHITPTRDVHVKKQFFNNKEYRKIKQTVDRLELCKTNIF